ncbi:hypothetical protein F5Y04DRAFT_293200 [Hypomontagnella monticulosa]|nr:hypothetical protein F5Y04DRAFT_293200 [Hypomontagnella monticulosa]
MDSTSLDRGRPLDETSSHLPGTARSSTHPNLNGENEARAGRKPRFGMPKVRTGCAVCKIRRVKCDETKPFCIRCTSTGRKCEGYPPILKRKPREGNVAKGKAPVTSSGAAITGYNVFQLYPPALTAPDPTATIGNVERKSLHFFWVATEHDISRNFCPDFWGQLVLQASREYPTVQYALDAVSALYKAYMFMEHTTHRSQGVLDTATTRSALVCYNKAVKLISDDLSAGTIPIQAVLICCLLFVWLEFMRNDFATGIKHLQSGLAILHENLSVSSRNDSVSTRIDESLPHIFTCLQLQATVHGCPSSDFNSLPMKCPSEAIINLYPSVFTTLAEARYYLTRRLVYIYQFVREKQTFEHSKGFQVAGCPEWPQLMAKRDAHMRELMRWNAAFQHSKPSTAKYAAESVGVLLLRLNFEAALMVLRSMFFNSEMQFDEYNDVFELMLSLAEKILHAGAPKGQRPLLSLDTGVIPALCYIIAKCRERTIRYRAMEALKHAPLREGMWHKDSIIAATNWKVAMEERLAAGILDKEQHPLPGAARIYRAMVLDATVDGKSAVVRFNTDPADSSGLESELNGMLSKLGDMI